MTTKPPSNPNTPRPNRRFSMQTFVVFFASVQIFFLVLYISQKESGAFSYGIIDESFTSVGNMLAAGLYEDPPDFDDDLEIEYFEAGVDSVVVEVLDTEARKVIAHDMQVERDERDEATVGAEEQRENEREEGEMEGEGDEASEVEEVDEVVIIEDENDEAMAKAAEATEVGEVLDDQLVAEKGDPADNDYLDVGVGESHDEIGEEAKLRLVRPRPSRIPMPSPGILRYLFREKHLEERQPVDEKYRPFYEAFSVGNTGWMKYVSRRFTDRSKPQLWAVATYFNPAQYKRKKDQYDRFRTAMRTQGVNLLTIEVAFTVQRKAFLKYTCTDTYRGKKLPERKDSRQKVPHFECFHGYGICKGGTWYCPEDPGSAVFRSMNTSLELRPFYDADILLQSHAFSALWMKERMYNIAVTHLPDSCTKVLLIDNDITFHDPKWPQKLTNILDKYKVVQPYDYAVRLQLNEQLPCPKCDPRAYRYRSIYRNNFAMAVRHIKDEGCMEKDYPTRISGHAHAYRREVLERHGLYDRSIVGGGDMLALYGAIEGSNCLNGSKHLEKHIDKMLPTEGLHDDYFRWAMNFYEDVQYSIGFMESTIFHLYHGPEKHRHYQSRVEILQRGNFTPATDLIEDTNFLYRWTDYVLHSKRGLQKEIFEYFNSRREDFKPMSGDVKKKVRKQRTGDGKVVYMRVKGRGTVPIKVSSKDSAKSKAKKKTKS